MRGEQLARQWQILLYLSNSFQGRRLDQITEQVGCSDRSVRRDIKALQHAGFAIYSEKVGQSTVWRMDEAFGSNPPIPLTNAEIIALLLAETELRGQSSDFITESFSAVTEKILRSRPKAFREQMELLRERFYGGQGGAPAGSSSSQEIFELVAGAITRNHKLSVTYKASSGKKTTNRIIAPMHIWVVNNSRYLIAYCYKRKSVRTFHMKRFQRVEELSEKFEVTWEFDMKKHAEGTYGVFHAEPQMIEVWFDPVLRTYIRDTPLHASQEIITGKDGFIVRLEVGINDSLVSRIMGFGSLARVLSPDGLAILVMERHREAYETYSRPTPDSGPSLPLAFD